MKCGMPLLPVVTNLSVSVQHGLNSIQSLTSQRTRRRHSYIIWKIMLKKLDNWSTFLVPYPHDEKGDKHEIE